MVSIRLDQDVRPLSLFRARVAEFINEVRLTGRPLLVTQHGRGAVVIIDVREFEAMRHRLEQLEREAASPGRQAHGEGSSGTQIYSGVCTSPAAPPSPASRPSQ